MRWAKFLVRTRGFILFTSHRSSTGVKLQEREAITKLHFMSGTKKSRFTALQEVLASGGLAIG
jgi:hypothetical protein